MKQVAPHIAVFIGLLHVSFASAQDVASFKATIRPFLDAHCIDCHGPDVKKANLRLDELKVDFADPDVARAWIKVLDRVHSGEMPPMKRPRPDKKEIAAVTQWLRSTLHEASLQTQRKQGRVVLRRLNRTEYETTLRDLLGPQVQVQDLLPEDSSAAGFDNVSAVLDVSAVHLLRYQEAAEKALRSANPTPPAADPVKVRRGGMFGRGGTVEEISLRMSECVLRLKVDHGSVVATRDREVGGIVLKHEQIGLDEWVETASRELTELARSSETARLALERMLTD